MARVAATNTACTSLYGEGHLIIAAVVRNVGVGLFIPTRCKARKRPPLTLAPH
jgi:hypothetical protein